MVFGRIVEGSPREIGEKIAQIVGDRHVSVLLMEDNDPAMAPPLDENEFEKLIREMQAEATSVPHVNDSREAIYTRQEGE